MDASANLQSLVLPPQAPSFDDQLAEHRRATLRTKTALLTPASEHDLTPLTPSQGKVPAGLHGTLYRNGAGTRFRDAWIEGDGLVTAARFQGGRVHHQSRFVRTRRYAASEAFMAGDSNALERARKGLLPDSEANTSVLMIAGRLFALWEAAPPWELAPDTLETLGECSFDDQLRTRSWRGQDGFTAHPRWDAEKGEVWTFGVRYLPSARLTVYRMDQGARLRPVREIALPRRYLVHDCALTPNYVVFSLGPAALEVGPFAPRPKHLAGAFAWQPGQPTRIVLVPRDGRPETIIETEPFFQWHFAGAFEQGSEVFFDLVRFRRFSAQAIASFSAALDPDTASYGTLWRYRARLAGKGAGSVESYPVSSVPLEFPTVDPRRQLGGYRHVYGAAVRAPESGMNFTSVAKYDTWTGTVDDCDYGPGHSVSEPLFVPRESHRLGADDDGWLLAYHREFASDRHELLIFDARAVADGPICALPVPSIGSSFHGQWVSA